MTWDDLQFRIMTAADDAHGEAGAGTSDVFPPFDTQYLASTLFWLIVTFTVLYIALSRFLLPRVGTLIEDRRDRIADDLDAASRMQADAEAAETAFNKALADAKAKAHAVAETTRNSINAEIEKETAAADAEALEHQQSAEARIQKATVKAMSHVNEVAVDTTQEIIAKLTGKKPTAAAVKKAVTAAAKS